MKKLLLFLFVLISLTNSAQTYFNIHVAQDTIVVPQGQSATFNISGTPLSGFSSTLYLSASSTPCSLDFAISPAALNAPYTNADLLVQNTSATLPDTFKVVVKAENGPYNAFDTCYVVIVPSTDVKWAVFTAANSGLQESFAYSLHLDHGNNDIWFIQNGGGMYTAFGRYNGYSWETHSLVMSNGRHTITDNCGNNFLDTVESVSDFSSGVLGGLYADSTDLWLGVSGGIVGVDKNTMSVFADTSLGFLQSGSTNDRIAKDYSNRIWVASLSGLYMYNGSYWKVFNSTNSYLTDGIIRCVTVDKFNKVWVGMNTDGLYSFDGTFWNVYTPANSNLMTTDFFSLKTDTDGWPIANGWMKFNGTNFDFLTVGGVPVDSVTRWSIGGSGIIGNDGVSDFPVEAINGGAQIFDFSTTQVRDMIKDSLNNIWIATDNGILVYNNDGLGALFGRPRVLYNTTAVPASVPQYSKSGKEDFIFPNPSDGRFTLRISTDKQEPVNCRIMDANGRIIKNENVNGKNGYQELAFDISQYAAGLYYITVSSPTFTRSQKLVLSK